MTQYEYIKKVRRLIRLNGGMTTRQIAQTLRCDSAKVHQALLVMGDAYIDRWTMAHRRWTPVYELAEIPENCPKPE